MLSARTNGSAIAKVTFNGDTKRVTLNGDYEELVTRTRASFSDLSTGPVKFFYVDEENDMISVSSQADLSEALDLSNQLKLTVAQSAKSAHQQLTSVLAPHSEDWEEIKAEESELSGDKVELI